MQKWEWIPRKILTNMKRLLINRDTVTITRHMHPKTASWTNEYETLLHSTIIFFKRALDISGFLLSFIRGNAKHSNKYQGWPFYTDNLNTCTWLLMTILSVIKFIDCLILVFHQVTSITATCIFTRTSLQIIIHVDENVGCVDGPKI